MPRPASVPARGRTGRIQLIGAVVLAAVVVLTWLQAPWTERLQGAWFDAHQALAPRQLRGLPVTVIEIDQKSLLAQGQWPWPRNLLARLVDAVNRARPAVIGVNILMPESDALSVERLLARTGSLDGAEAGAGTLDAALARALRSRPSNDAELARALAGAPSVLVVAGTPEPTGMPLRATPVVVRALPAAAAASAPVVPPVARHAGALTSIDELDRAAHGRGLISADPSRGVIRRIPLVVSVDGTLVPTLALEMLRVAMQVPMLRLTTSPDAVAAVAVGDRVVATEADAAVRVYFSPRRAERVVSAADVLEGRGDPALIERHMVLIGLAGIGLLEYQDTPIGERMSGTEVHAQLLENLIDDTLLRRPQWAPRAEALWVIALGALLIWATPRWRPFSATLLMLACVALPVLLAYLLFRSQRLLFDAATPALGLLLLFVTLLVLTLAESTRHRRSLEWVVADQREQGARIAGELEAAQRIQMATLPPADLLQADDRIELAALLVPAREVGGDLYDYFMLDERRLFFLVGDVAGKGLSASIFMAVSKALCKSAMLRMSHADIGEIIAAANAEVSRDNPEMLFVTVFAGILDLDSGDLAYCNAGHDNPWLLHAADATPRRITDGDGPPLCAADGFAYRGGRCRLAPGTWLCLMTDGVTEAQNRAAELYGQARVQAVLRDARGAELDARGVVEALHVDVEVFAAGAEAADDLTILVLRWRGPGTRG
jgi:adenylate cyclase